MCLPFLRRHYHVHSRTGLTNNLALHCAMISFGILAWVRDPLTASSTLLVRYKLKPILDINLYAINSMLDEPTEPSEAKSHKNVPIKFK